MSNIEIINAEEGNLQNITLEIPKNKMVVFTGLSGSGKTTLLMDVLFDECQRQYLEALSMQGIRKPKVERIKGASPAIVIAQTDANSNPRSTVGTQSDIYTDLRMIYEKLGVRKCPYCGEMITQAECKEETEKRNNEFFVYMYCCKCKKRMEKLTRTNFSFNTKEGACKTCEGLGKIHSIKRERIVNEALTLEEGAVLYWEKQYANYQISILYKAYEHYGLPIPSNIPVTHFNPLQKDILYQGIESEMLKQKLPEIKQPKTAGHGKFEGAIPILWRRYVEKEGNKTALEDYFDIIACTDCNGERLCEASREVTVKQERLPQLSKFSLEKLHAWNQELKNSLSKKHLDMVQDYLLDMDTKLARFVNVGLGYLSLDRQIITLSGGELQRLRLAAVLDSDLSGIIYILDEPTAGLHPRDTNGLLKILRKLRDLGNTVLVIEHDTDIIKAADYIVEIGPGSGQYGGKVVAEGTLKEIKDKEAFLTGKYLEDTWTEKKDIRKTFGKIEIQNADKFNLKNINVSIPTGCFVSVTGPSGSGKSTLIFEVLAQKEPYGDKNKVTGLEPFDKIIQIEQSPISRMKRSNVATYSDVYTEIRNVFAKTETAQKKKFLPKHFSFNTAGGRCENCQGLGHIENNMLFFTNTEIICPVCNGKQFQEEVLQVLYNGLSIKDVLMLSIKEASDFFVKQPKILRILSLLQEAGLSYLELGQSLTTLSGGEGQRLKLAKELFAAAEHKKNLYLMDEPTTGLHPQDIEHFLVLLNKIVDAGNTIVVVEHNKQLIAQCDWMIELGPDGGERGGRLIYQGAPK